VNLPVKPPILPMLAKRVGALPEGNNWLFEPKWDGFRALVFRDGDEIVLQSRDQKTLNRYFPELVETLLVQLPERCVLDGEIVIAGGRGTRLRKAAVAHTSRCFQSEVAGKGSSCFYGVL
jgi:ATP-dependent DNA ligase